MDLVDVDADVVIEMVVWLVGAMDVFSFGVGCWVSERGRRSGWDGMWRVKGWGLGRVGWWGRGQGSRGLTR